MKRLARGPRVLLVVVLAVALLVAGCTGDGDEVGVPEGLLSAETVGGTATRDFTEFGGCVCSAGHGLDTPELFGSASPENTIGYRRTHDGHEELVIIGVWPQRPSSAREGLQALTAGLEDSPRREAQPGATARRLPASHPDTVAFASVRPRVFTSMEPTEADERVSIWRSYTYLEAESYTGDRGTLVMVSIQATGEVDLSAEDLDRLTTAQINQTLGRAT